MEKENFGLAFRGAQDRQDHLAKMLPDALYLNGDLPSVVRRLEDPESFYDSQSGKEVIIFTPKSFKVFRELYTAGKNMIISPWIKTAYQRKISGLNIQFNNLKSLRSVISESGI